MKNEVLEMVQNIETMGSNWHNKMEEVKKMIMNILHVTDIISIFFVHH